MLRHLRIYTVGTEQREAFYACWNAHARPLMQHHGFHIEQEWEGQVDPVSADPIPRITRLILAARHPGRPSSDSQVFEFGCVLAGEDQNVADARGAPSSGTSGGGA